MIETIERTREEHSTDEIRNADGSSRISKTSVVTKERATRSTNLQSPMDTNWKMSTWTPVQSTPRNVKAIKYNNDGQSSALVPTTSGALMTPQRNIRQLSNGLIEMVTTTTSTTTTTIRVTKKLDHISISKDGMYEHQICNRMVYELQLIVDECIQLIYLYCIFFGAILESTGPTDKPFKRQMKRRPSETELNHHIDFHDDDNDLPSTPKPNPPFSKEIVVYEGKTPVSAKTRKKDITVPSSKIEQKLLEKTPNGRFTMEQKRQSKSAIRGIRIGHDESLTLIHTDDNRPKAITATDDDEEDIMQHLKKPQRTLLAKHKFAE